MRSFSTPIQNYIDSRAGVRVRGLFWIEAKNRSTLATETMGLWTGEDNRDFSIGGDTRNYIGVGTGLVIPTIPREVGLTVRYITVYLSPISEDVNTAIRGYEPRLAPVQIHRALYDLETDELIDEPTREFKGFVETIQIDTKEGEGLVAVKLASQALRLTRSLGIKKSDQSQRLRDADDGFRQYQDTSGAVTSVFWGELEGRPQSNSGGVQGRRRR